MSRRNSGKKRNRTKSLLGGNNNTRPPQKQHAGDVSVVSKDSDMSLRQRTEIFAGPLPHPDMLEKYDSIYPGAAKIILDTFQQEAQHRHEQERSVVTNEYQMAKRGQIFAFLIACVALIVGAICAAYGAQIVGSVIGGSTLVGLVSVFVIGRGHQSDHDQPAHAASRQ